MKTQIQPHILSQGSNRVLDYFITEYNENLKRCLEEIKPLANLLRPLLQNPNVQQINEMLGLFPPSITVNAECLYTS